MHNPRVVIFRQEDLLCVPEDFTKVIDINILKTSDIVLVTNARSQRCYIVKNRYDVVEKRKEIHIQDMFQYINVWLY